MHPSFVAGGFGGFDDDGELDLALGDFETLGTPLSSLAHRHYNLLTREPMQMPVQAEAVTGMVTST
jgi:hypothetical protein